MDYGFFEPPPDKDGNKPLKPARAAPARGALDGVRKDIQAAKDAGVSYDPRGAGSAWNHNFLNKKPWHPLTFKNMARVWEAEQRNYEKEKRKADAAAEFASEQEYLKTISLLRRARWVGGGPVAASAEVRLRGGGGRTGVLVGSGGEEEQRRYRERQSVSFLYMKPPGYDAVLERAERDNAAAAAAGASGAPAAQAAAAAAPGPGGQQQRRPAAAAAGGHLQNVIQGFAAAAVAAQQREAQVLQLKHLPSAGRSPPRGGALPDAENQQFVVAEMDSEEEEEALRLAAMPEAERRRAARRAERQRRRAKRQARRAARQAQEAAQQQELEQAKAFLRAAGLEVPESGSSGGGSSDSDNGSGSDSGDAGSGGGRRRRDREGSGKQGKRGRERRSSKEHRKSKRRRRERKRE
eukprot:scaffold11.g3840.t1